MSRGKGCVDHGHHEMKGQRRSKVKLRSAVQRGQYISKLILQTYLLVPTHGNRDLECNL